MEPAAAILAQLRERKSAYQSLLSTSEALEAGNKDGESNLTGALAELHALRESQRTQSAELDTLRALQSMVQVDKKDLMMELDRAKR